MNVLMDRPKTNFLKTKMHFICMFAVVLSNKKYLQLIVCNILL